LTWALDITMANYFRYVSNRKWQYQMFCHMQIFTTNSKWFYNFLLQPRSTYIFDIKRKMFNLTQLRSVPCCHSLFYYKGDK